MSENKKEKYSFSKLSCYGNCPKNYYLTYIKHVERSQNIYGLAGGDAHELTQALEIGEMTNKQAVEDWESKMDIYEFCGEANFPTTKSKENYITGIRNDKTEIRQIHYKNHFARCIGDCPRPTIIANINCYKSDGYKHVATVVLLHRKSITVARQKHNSCKAKA